MGVEVSSLVPTEVMIFAQTSLCLPNTKSEINVEHYFCNNKLITGPTQYYHVTDIPVHLQVDLHLPIALNDNEVYSKYFVLGDC